MFLDCDLSQLGQSNIMFNSVSYIEFILTMFLPNKDNFVCNSVLSNLSKMHIKEYIAFLWPSARAGANDKTTSKK